MTRRGHNGDGGSWMNSCLRQRNRGGPRLGVYRFCLFFLVPGYVITSLVLWNSVSLSPNNALIDAALGRKNRLLYIGKFGLGHRFSKMVAAYHLASSNDDLCPWLDEFVVQWGHCEGDGSHNDTTTPDIFAHLFGSNTLPVACRRFPKTTQRRDIDVAAAGINQRIRNNPKTVIVRNDVRGYFAGQSYKNAKIPLSLAALALPSHAWNDKMNFDQAFFRELLNAFRGRFGTTLDSFQRQHAWKDHYVVGLHLRAGNGEQDHFVQADRGVANSTEWCRTLVETLQCVLRDVVSDKAGSSSSPLLFLATDTAALIPVVEETLVDVPVIVFPQERLPSQQGVSYQKWSVGEQCYAGWTSAMTDMALLADSDLLVAATRSTFTQILPLSQILSQNDTGKYKFCEAGNAGITMTCFENRQAWFLRQEGETTWRQTSSNSLGQCESFKPRPMGTPPASNGAGGDDDSRIVHKVMVHLPDVEKDPLLKDAVAFLQDARSEEERYYYGQAFSRKYRGGDNSVFRPEWTLFFEGAQGWV